MPHCKECAKEKSHKWNQENKEKQSSYRKKYHKNNKERSKERNEKWRARGGLREWGKENKDRLKEYREKRYNKHHDISAAEWENCKNYFNNSCAYCGLHIEEHFMNRLGSLIKSDFHKEHVVHDGANDISNCVPSCKSCNSEKGTFLLQDWYNENNVKFTNERMKKIDKWLDEDYSKYK